MKTIPMDCFAFAGLTGDVSISMKQLKKVLAHIQLSDLCDCPDIAARSVDGMRDVF